MDNGLKVLIILDVLAWAIFAFAQYNLTKNHYIVYQIQWFFDTWKRDSESRFFIVSLVRFIYKTKIQKAYFEYRIKRIERSI